MSDLGAGAHSVSTHNDSENEHRYDTIYGNKNMCRNCSRITVDCNSTLRDQNRPETQGQYESQLHQTKVGT